MFDITLTRSLYAGWPTTEVNAWLWGKFVAGTYHIKVQATAAGSPGSYLIQTYVDHAYAETASKCTSIATSFNDTWSGCQWHLDNRNQFGAGGGQDINVDSVWDPDDPASMGAGINVAVIDAGFHAEHEDLRDNAVPAKNSRNTDGRPYFDAYQTHGTEVAGLIAARDNDLGVRGVAPRASIYGYDLTTSRGVIDQAERATAAAHERAVTAVYNNSWGTGQSSTPKSVSAVWEMAVREGVKSGFGGKGAFYVWAAGNGYLLGDDVNLDGLKNYYAVTAACAVNYNDVRASYSDVGAALWVCAPSGDIRSGLPGVTTTLNGDRYNDAVTGTSAATPIVSGVAALVRAANPELTWRDVKLILAASARKSDAANSGWQQGATKYGGTGNYDFNREYGFGVVDAGAAVALAKQWVNLPPMVEQSVTASGGELAITDRTSGVDPVTITSTVTLGSEVEFIEFVELNTTWDHDSIRDLKIELVSPAGTVSLILPHLPIRIHRAIPFRSAYRFGSAQHLGEAAAGEWTLRITDRYAGRGGSLKSWSLKVFGHEIVPTAPQSTSASSGSNQLTIDWSAPAVSGPNAVGSYDLRYRRADDPDAAWTEVLDIAISDAAAYDLTDLRGGVQYELQVRAENANGVGPWSETFTGTTIAVAPSAPAVTSITEQARELLVAWSPPLDGWASISRYDLRHIESDRTDDEKMVESNWTQTASAWTTGGGALEASISGLTNGQQYDVQIRATNAVGTSDWSETATGTPMAANQDPEFPASETGARSVDENTPANRNIGTAVAATDADNNRLIYSISGADAALFDVVASSGQLRTKSALDRESRGSYSFTMSVHDGVDINGNSDTTVDDTISVTVTVDDVDEPADISLSASGGVTANDNALAVDENHDGTLAAFSASDPENKAGLTYTWSLGGSDRGDFAITSAGVLSFVNIPDFERPADSGANNVYGVTVSARDSDNKTGSVAVTVTVDAVNERPTIVGDAAASIEEGGTLLVGTFRAADAESALIAWQPLAGYDRDKFEFTASNGRLVFKAAPDYEDATDSGGDNVYDVTLSVSAGGHTTTFDVAVSVTNKEEGGALGLSSPQPQADADYTATLSDPDDVSSTDWTWERSTSRSGPWTAVTGATSGVTTSVYRPGAGDVGYFLRVSAAYTDGHGPDKSRSVVSANSVRVAPISNVAPSFDESAPTRSVRENARARAAVWMSVRATDTDSGDVVTYELSGRTCSRSTATADRSASSRTVRSTMRRRPRTA